MIAVPAVPASASACSKRFTVAMGERAVRATFLGTKRVRPIEYVRLRRYVRCQRNPRARPLVRAFWRAQEAAWKLRLHPPAPAFFGPVLASWFDDAGSTACGIHATYGFASLFLACGQTVTMVGPNGRPVVATMEDHGPYIAGRTFDLNPGLKAALGCGDLCEVRYR